MGQRDRSREQDSPQKKSEEQKSAVCKEKYTQYTQWNRNVGKEKYSLQKPSLAVAGKFLLMFSPNSLKEFMVGVVSNTNIFITHVRLYK